MADPPPWKERWLRLVAALRDVPDAAQEARLLQALGAPSGPRVLAFANAHAFNAAARDAVFCDDLLAADVLVRDGIGVAILLRLLGRAPGRNLNGTDLIPRLLREQAGRPVALFGTAEPWLSRACEVVARDLAPGASLVTADGFQPPGDYLRLARAHRPALIVLAMGMPRQERVAQVLREGLGSPCLIVCGGAILDFLGGRVARAPAPLRRLGLEWAWRLAREPRRLFGRYVLGNPLFLARALRLAISRPARDDRGPVAR